MAKIVFIGAGSTVFARNLLGDIFGHVELADSEIALFDIDAERLETSELVARRVADAVDAEPKIVATTDRRAALEGADYAINMIQVGGYEPATVTDFEVPKEFGLRQTIADTLGIGGIMRGLRTIPVMLDMCADMEELCPDVWFLNYTNPMAINCRAVNRATDDSYRRLVPQRAGNRVRALARPRHPVPRHHVPRGRHQSHGVLPAVRTRR